MCVVGMASAYAQAPYDEYVDEVRGDTLVVKDFVGMGNNPNSLVNVVSADSVDVPEGRVYLLQRNGWYPLLEDLFTPTDRAVEIVGEGEGSVVQGTIDDGYPAVISGIFLSESESNEGDLFQFQNDATLKNVAMTPTHSEGTIGWTFFYAASANNTLTLDNVIMETTQWVFAQSNDYAGTELIIKNSYFPNMTGYTCRRNGGVYDNVSNNTQTIHVENTTHVMGAGTTYKMRGYPINQVTFNHNTFVNISGQVLGTWGHQNDYIVTNNLFVNANVQAYITGLDAAEFDQDYLPHGLINVDTLRYVDVDGQERLGIDSTWIRENYDMEPSEFGPDDRKVLVSHNGIYWNDRVYEIPQTLNNNGVECPADEAESDCIDPNAEWVSQAMTMNSRTQAMFDNDEMWPYLNEGPWIEAGAPEFTDDAGLMGDEILQDLIDWSVSAASTPDSYMPHWRSPENPYEENVIYSDYPVYADLSYSNAAYLMGSTDGQPLGDLNWFPDAKASFEANYDAHYATLRTALETGAEIGVSNERGSLDVPNSIKLDQNYPNPFNPTTQISFNLPQAQEVSLKVYDMLGREVATLVNNKRFAAGESSVTFDASNLSSGMYIYRLTSSNITISKKMTLIK